MIYFTASLYSQAHLLLVLFIHTTQCHTHTLIQQPQSTSTTTTPDAAHRIIPALQLEGCCHMTVPLPLVPPLYFSPHVQTQRLSLCLL